MGGSRERPVLLLSPCSEIVLKVYVVETEKRKPASARCQHGWQLLMAVADQTQGLSQPDAFKH